MEWTIGPSLAQEACVSIRLVGGGEQGRRFSLDSLKSRTRRCPPPSALSDSGPTPVTSVRAAAAPSAVLAGSGGVGWRFAECGQRQEQSRGKTAEMSHFSGQGHHEGAKWRKRQPLAGGQKYESKLAGPRHLGQSG